MRIRPANLDDVTQLVKLGKDLLNLHTEFDINYYQLEENFDESFGAWVKNQINSNYQFLIVAQNETDGQIAGFISGFIKSLFPWFKTKSVGHISYMIINPKFQRQGIGKLLENTAKEWFKSKNISYLELYVEEKNEIGKIAWNKYGFLPFKKFLQKKI